MGKAKDWEQSHGADYLRELFIYEPDTGILRNRVDRGGKAKAGSVTGWVDDYGYRLVSVAGRSIIASRVCYCIHHGHWPQGQVDHINGIRDDNRACNLRAVSRSENLHNKGRQKNSTSGFNGVWWEKPKQVWHADVYFNKRHIFLGRFKSFYDACVAARNARLELGFSERHAGTLPEPNGQLCIEFQEAA